MALLPCVVAVLLLALLPGTALGNVQVQIDSDGIISIDELNAEADALSLSTSSDGTQHVITGNLSAVVLGVDCTSITPSEVRCPKGQSIVATLGEEGDTLTENAVGVAVAVDLGAGDDEFIANGVATLVSVAGGPGIDTITTGAGGDVLAGGDGNDILNGQGGVDDYFGEEGDDTIEARDGLAERISCGAGADQARNDFTDIIAECETGIDGDADGFGSAIDCNDAVARIFPGAPEVFENGVDEDCNGRDDVNLDRDGDGFARPVDCDDANAAVRPNAVERRGNAVDENCDNRAAPFAQFATVVSNRWAVASRFTFLRSLVVRNAPAGARIVLRCDGGGCPIDRARRRTVRRNLAKVVLHRGFRRARLRPGARLRLSITAPETIGRTYTYRVKQRALPDSRIVCRAPGARKGRAC